MNNTSTTNYSDNLDELISRSIQENKLNKQDDNGCTLLHTASAKGCVPSVDTLISAGANVNIKNNHNRIPMAVATTKPVQQSLVFAGSHINNLEQTALHYAAERMTADATFKLSDKWDKLNTGDKNDTTPLDVSIYKNDTEKIDILIDVPYSIGFTPLTFSIMQDDFEEASDLLSNGADVNKNDVFGRQPLLYAISNENVGLVGALLNKGAHVNKADSKGLFPVHRAVLKQNIAIIQLLVKAGADVNARSKSGKTPLHIACDKSLIDIAKILQNAGASLKIPDNKGNLPDILNITVKSSPIHHSVFQAKSKVYIPQFKVPFAEVYEMWYTLENGVYPD